MAEGSGFCRDCLAPAPDAATRCPACRSSRLLRHPELGSLSIAHVDCDAFYAAVEKRDDPSLRDRPVIVGGGRRGVVTTACYIARIDGARSAMPMYQALKLCPDAVVVRPDMAKYAAVSREIRARMEALTPAVEPLSLDEAFLDLSGTERVHGEPPARALARLARAIREEIGITVSVGLSHCKFLAKIASDLDKPRGFSVIGRAESVDFLDPLPVSAIWGVGGTLGRKLKADGLLTVGDLRRAEEATLIRRYGSMGRRLHALSHARDARRVDPRSPAKSISNETTFGEDIGARDLLEAHLWRLSEKVAARCKAKGVEGRTVTLKLKGPDFRLLTRARTLDAPTQMADAIFRSARASLAGVGEGRAWRLIGVGVSALSAAAEDTGGAATDLFDPDAPRRAQAERAVDRIRARFGDAAVRKGRAWRLEDG